MKESHVGLPPDPTQARLCHHDSQIGGPEIPLRADLVQDEATTGKKVCILDNPLPAPAQGTLLTSRMIRVMSKAQSHEFSPRKMCW